MAGLLMAVIALPQERPPTPGNRLHNTSAELDTSAWVTAGAARVEEYDGTRCFVVRNGGSFEQAVMLPPYAEAEAFARRYGR
ncbi:MAG: hypothetical protein A3G21_20045 [Acidobacteria bacterium RIFCSPLOWO2_12_FULL_66_21]|nr:MAG: hypothetical protein A3G21_20045 [Acidobacteria bacterium RIFCSPLOWO2_12_FULL_66_21]